MQYPSVVDKFTYTCLGIMIWMEMHSDHALSFIHFFLRKHMQEGVWLMHISKFFA